jgi:hypothetical protein
MVITEAGVKAQWAKLLRSMLAEHRAKHPEENRTDNELIICFMETFVAYGVISKHNGCYRIGPLD